MCLGIPGKVLAWTVHDPLFGRAIIEFAGVRRECQMACVPDAKPGEFVIVHAGLALCRLNPEEAQLTLRQLAQLELHESPIGPQTMQTATPSTNLAPNSPPEH
jgi:hydrogenase expression/formation protein HypC